MLFEAPNKIHAETGGFPEGSLVRSLVFVSDGKTMATLGVPAAEIRRRDFNLDEVSSRMGLPISR